MKKIIKTSLLFTVLIMLSFNYSPAIEGILPDSLVVGDMMEDFSLKNIDTMKEISFFKDIKGKHHATAVIFMTTTCSACKAEMALLSNFASDFSDKLKVYAVSVDIDGENTVPEYDKEYGFNVTYLLDPDFTIPQRYGFVYTPALVVINKDGEILFLKGGYSPIEDDKIIEALKAAIQ